MYIDTVQSVNGAVNFSFPSDNQLAVSIPYVPFCHDTRLNFYVDGICEQNAAVTDFPRSQPQLPDPCEFTVNFTKALNYHVSIFASSDGSSIGGDSCHLNLTGQDIHNYTISCKCARLWEGVGEEI